MLERSSMTFVRTHLTEALRIAEIGVWKGSNARRLLTLNVQMLVLIDPYKPYKRHSEMKILTSAKQEMLRKILHHPKAEVVSMLFMQSEQAAPRFPDLFFDYVYIDGDHVKDAVARDLAAWYPKVRTGGVFAGHDYLTSSAVATVVNTFCREVGEHVLYYEGDNSPCMENSDWWVVKGERNGVR